MLFFLAVDVVVVRLVVEDIGVSGELFVLFLTIKTTAGVEVRSVKSGGDALGCDCVDELGVLTEVNMLADFELNVVDLTGCGLLVVASSFATENAFVGKAYFWATEAFAEITVEFVDWIEVENAESLKLNPICFTAVNRCDPREVGVFDAVVVRPIVTSSGGKTFSFVVVSVKAAVPSDVRNALVVSRRGMFA